MKRSILLFGFFFLTISAFGQNTLIVDNTGSAPTGDHIYTNLQDAIDAAQAGDVIQVMPSPTQNGNINLNSKNNLTISGIGINPQLLGTPTAERSQVGNIVIIGSSNIVLTGFTGAILQVANASASSTELILDKMHITGFTIESLSNSVFRNSFINTSANSKIESPASGIQFVNCIVTGVFPSIHNTNFTNNIIYSYNSVVSNNILNSVFRNNIIISNNQFTTNPSNSDNSVYEFNYSENPLPTSGTNAGTGNIGTLTGTLFVDSNIDFNTPWNRIWRPELGSNNLIDAGKDGTNIGPTGGSSPYKLDSSPLPFIKDLIAPITIKKGTDTEVTIKAKGN